MQEFNGKDLTYHHAEIARLTEAIAAARPNARATGALRAKLKYHEDQLGRPPRLPGADSIAAIRKRRTASKG